MCIYFSRYLAIVHPLRYTSLVTRSRCILVILSIWLLSAVTALVQLSWLDPFHHEVSELPTDDIMKAEYIYDVLFLALFFFLPFVLMSLTYACIIFEIIRQSRNIRKECVPSLRNEKNRSRTRHEWKAVAIFAAMLFVYITCWLPYFGLRRFDISDIPLPLVYTIVWLRFVTSLINPCMYIIGKQDFRKAISDLAFKRRKVNLTTISRPTVRATVASDEDVNELMLLKPLSKG